MKRAEVVLIPYPAMGHIVAVVELAKILIQHDDRISTTVLVMQPALDSSTTKYIESVAVSTLPNRMRIIELPAIEIGVGQNRVISLITPGHKPLVKEFVSNLKTQSEFSPDCPRLGGFIFDTFVTGNSGLTDLANEFGVPWYIFSASGAAFLGCMSYLLALHDQQKVDITEFKNSDTELEIPCLVNALPARLVPSMALQKESLTHLLKNARYLNEATGILVNTSIEIESHAIRSLSDGKAPPLYPVGPIVKDERNGDDVGSDQISGQRNVMEWLDDQPVSSVVFLCFGSWGSFGEDQVREIACALEHSGHPFLWSLRKPAPKSKGKKEAPSDFVNFEEFLPEGFLLRTAKIGKVIGFAPQVDILAHPSVGGFVTHCGWNSILESIYFGVPTATWPLYAEQQFNAFQMVVDLGLAVEIKMDYRRDFTGENEVIVSASDIMKGIKCMMEDSEIRKKVKEMSKVSKNALMEGGSSYAAFDRVIEDIMAKIP